MMSFKVFCFSLIFLFLFLENELCPVPWLHAMLLKTEEFYIFFYSWILNVLVFFCIWWILLFACFIKRFKKPTVINICYVYMYTKILYFYFISDSERFFFDLALLRNYMRQTVSHVYNFPWNIFRRNILWRIRYVVWIREAV